MKATTDMFHYNKKDNTMVCDISTIEGNKCFTKERTLPIVSHVTGKTVVFTLKECITEDREGETVAYKYTSTDNPVEVILFND